MTALFSAPAVRLLATLGEPAIYTAVSPAGTLTVLAIVERDLMTPVAGMEGMTLDRRTVITMLTAALTGRTPTQGDTVRVGGENWKVLALEQDDGYLIRLRVRAFPWQGWGGTGQGGATLAATGEHG